MLDWLGRLLGGAAHRAEAGLLSLVHLALAGLASVIEFVFKDVSREWTRFIHSGEQFAKSVLAHVHQVYAWLHRVITYDIPHFAHTAWWWVTHPGDLSKILGWHLVAWLEDHAWDVAHWLGGFVTSLIVRNARRVVQVAEHIIAAVL